MFDRVTFDSQVLGGRACIGGMRISVSQALGHLANGTSVDEIVEDSPTSSAPTSNRRCSTQPGWPGRLAARDCLAVDAATVAELLPGGAARTEIAPPPLTRLPPRRHLH